MRTRIIIQCRLSSTRLPAKALLPIAGIPLMVLCARRAGNTGLPVLVATSTEPADDQIDQYLRTAKLPCFRGSHDDVLKRFVDATRDMPDDAVVVRLTADNVFPDGSFIEELMNNLMENSIDYIGTSSPCDGLPYGLSAEAFTVGALRRAHENAETAHDREHVTPWIRRTAGEHLFRPSRLKGDFSHLRCTIDTFDDYQRVVKVFDGVDDPVAVPWVSLCEKLSRLPGEPARRVPFVRKGQAVHSVLTLGTAQLGLGYGRVNSTGQPSMEDACAMVRGAIAHGITALDTARAYGDSERRIGRALEGGLDSQVTVITKLDPLDGISESDSEPAIRNAVDASAFRSCTELKTQCLDTLLLHRWKHRTLKGGALWRRLKELQALGYVKNLGVSAQSPREAIEALGDPDVTHIQLPLNILDWRWREQGIATHAAQRPDVIIHARSVYLQGILLADADAWPPIPGADARTLLVLLDTLVGETRRESRADLCLAYARAHPWITSVVVGMETSAQLLANIDLFKKPPLTDDEVEIVNARLPRVPEQLLDPARWAA